MKDNLLSNAEEQSVQPTKEAPMLDRMTDAAAIIIPSGKLDADFYNASDLDGVTESLFGSGNLNYMILQSRQIDLSSINDGSDPYYQNSGEGIAGSLLGAAALQKIIDAVDARNTILGPSSITGDNTNQGSGNVSAEGGNTAAGNTENTLGSIAFKDVTTRDIFSDTQEGIFRSSHDGTNGTSGEDGVNGNNGVTGPGGSNGNSGNNGANGNNGNDGQNGTPGDGGGGEDTDDFDISVGNDIGPPHIDIPLDPIESIVGDIDLGIDITHGPNGINLGLDTVLAGIPLIKGDLPVNLPLLNPLLDHTLTGIENILTPPPAGHDTDVILTGNLGLPALNVNLDPLESILGDIDLGVDLSQANNGIVLGVDTILSGIPLVQTEIPVNLEQVADVLNDVSNISQNPVGTIEDLVSSILAPPDSGSDTDLALHNNLGLPNIYINLDPIENLVGDIDIGATLAGHNGDLTLDVDTIIAHIPLADITAETSLAGDTLSLIDQIAQTMVDNIPPAPAWPETGIGGISTALGVVVETSGQISTSLPDPIVSIFTDVANHGDSHGGGLLSGLGHGHHAGLFG